MQITAIQMHENDIMQAELELSRVNSALEIADRLMAFSAKNESHEEIQAELTMGLGVLATRLGFDTIEGALEYLDIEKTDVGFESVDGLRSLPGRIWAVVAKMIEVLVRKARMLYTAVFDRNAKQAKQTADTMDKFEARLVESDRTMEAHGLQNGDKINAELAETIKATGSFIFRDYKGHALSSEKIKEDISLLVPPKWRSDDFTAGTLAIDGKFPDLVTAATQALAYTKTVATAFDRSDYFILLDTVMNIRDVDMYNDIFNTLIPAVNKADEASIAELRLRGSQIKSYKKLIGEVYPTFIPERAGLLKMHSMMFSYTAERMDHNPTKKTPKGVPSLSYYALAELRSVLTKIETRRQQFATTIQAAKDRLEEMGINRSATLEAAVDDLARFHNGRNGEEIVKVQNIIRHIPKSHLNATAYLEACESYLRDLSAALNGYIVLCVSATFDQEA